MSKVFISHSARRTKIADRIRELMRPFGHSVISSKANQTDERPTEATTKSIAACDVVLALYDAQSNSVLFDLGIAFGLAKPVIVVARRDTELSRELRNIPCVRVTDFNEAAAYRILASIAMLTGRLSQRQIEHHPQFAERSFLQGLDEIDPMIFERRVLELFAKMNTVSTIMPNRSHERDFDFSFISDKGYLYIVELKLQSPSDLISIDSVRRLSDAAIDHKADGGILVTTSDYTDSARDFALRVPVQILLWRTEDVHQWDLKFQLTNARVTRRS